MLVSKLLTQDYDRSQFAASYCSASNNPVALAYLQRVDVRGFYRNGALVGGYALNNKAPYRYLEMVPSEARAAVAALTSKDGVVVEITCLWFDKHKVAAWERLYGYARLMIDAFARGQTVLAGSFSPKIAAVHRLALPHLHFEGVSTFCGPPRLFWLYSGTKADYFRGLVTQCCRVVRKLARHRATTDYKQSLSKGT